LRLQGTLLTCGNQFRAELERPQELTELFGPTLDESVVLAKEAEAAAAKELAARAKAYEVTEDDERRLRVYQEVSLFAFRD
jgi:hypothetical protein